MAKETEAPLELGEDRGRVPITGIYVDLPTRTVSFTQQDEIVGQLRFGSHAVVFDRAPRSIPQAVTSPAVSHVPNEEPPPAVEGDDSERRKPVTLQGKLKSKPREGRPDSKGNKTAWARLAVHEEGGESARMYSTTFHKHTADIALLLDKDAPVTVQGYPHINDDPDAKRMDTLSVVSVLAYPGKPARPTTP